ncbi:MAG: hypothetical protein M5R36_18385 [Deltaproteobacteria bacterium]|nr:hypothetical protein [Deltaproteobacteria bacterium]
MAALGARADHAAVRAMVVGARLPWDELPFDAVVTERPGVIGGGEGIALPPDHRTAFMDRVRRVFADVPDHADAKGMRLLLWPVRGSSMFTHLVEKTVGAAVALRGGAVSSVGCDAFLPVCDNITHQVTNRKSFCESCVAAHREWADATHSPVMWLSQLVRGDEREAIRGRAASMTLEAILGDEEDGIALGELVRASVIRYTARGRVVEADLDIAREYWIAARLMKIAAERACEKFRPTRAFTSHGIYATWGVAAEIFRRRNLPFYVYGLPYMRGRVLVTRNASYHDAFQNEREEDWSNFPMNDERERALTAYLDSKERGGAYDLAWHNYQPARTEPVTVNEGRARIALFTNVSWDAAVHRGAGAFEDVNAFVTETIAWAAGRDDVDLYVRIHPAETKHVWMPATERMECIIAARFEKLPEHIHIIGPDERVSSYELARRVDVSCVFITTIGHELAARGSAVVCAGPARYAGKGFTFDARSMGSIFRCWRARRKFRNRTPSARNAREDGLITTISGAPCRSGFSKAAISTARKN